MFRAESRTSKVLSVVLLLCLAAGMPAAAWAQEPLKYKLFWGLYQEPVAGGILVRGFTLDSPALAAGLKAGDIIVAVNNIPVANWPDVTAVTRDIPPYTPVPVKVKRSWGMLDLVIVPTGSVRWPVSPPRTPFAIPGVPAGQAGSPASPVEMLENMNVLKQVVIDPDTGRLDIIGDYDPAYATGPIPYLDILKTALKYPEPLLNLEPTPETWQYYGGWEWKGYMSFKIWQMLDGHPAMERERWQALRYLAGMYRLTPAEYALWHNYKTFDATGDYPPPEIAAVQNKALRNFGYSDAAGAYALLRNKSRDAALGALKLLGRGADAQTRLAQGGSQAALDNDLTVMAYAAICRRLGAEIAAAEEKYRQGKIDARAFIREAQTKVWPVRDQSGRLLAANTLMALNGIVVSPAVIRELSALPADCEAYIDPIGLDGASQLARIMYEADYSLKSIGIRPELFADRIPGFVSVPEYIFHKFKNGYDAVSHTWVEPGTVEMKVSPDRRAIAFGQATMKINYKYLPQPGQPVADAHQNTDLDEYAAMVTSHYEDLARILPAFHKAREAAKIVALARWLNQNNIAVDLSGVAQEQWVPPPRVPTFWAVVLFIRENTGQPLAGSAFSATLHTMRGFTGGCSFRASNNWAKTVTAPEAANDVSRQLAASAWLGRRAVAAAQAGDLDQARHLAELSAQAMIGNIREEDYVRLQLVVPHEKGYSAARVALNKGLVRETYDQIKNPDPAKLKKLAAIYDKVETEPLQVSDFLRKLQTRQLYAD